MKKQQQYDAHCMKNMLKYQRPAALEQTKMFLTGMEKMMGSQRMQSGMSSSSQASNNLLNEDESLEFPEFNF